MDAIVPPPDLPRHIEPLRSEPPGIERAAPSFGRLILGTTIASFVAFGSIFGTVLLLDQPGPQARIEALWNTRLIRTIADSDLPGTKLLPKPTLATLEGVDTTATGSLGAIPAPRSQFGAELGIADSLAGLRSLWNRISGAAGIATLRPLASIKDVGETHELRLVAGPFADAADAAALCARLSAEAPACTTVPFAGQDLAQ